MFAYFGKCLLLVTIMFLGVLFGMQQANNGMLSMKGYHDPSLKGAFTLTDGKDNEKEASILGETVTAKDLEEKQKEPGKGGDIQYVFKSRTSAFEHRNQYCPVNV